MAGKKTPTPLEVAWASKTPEEREALMERAIKELEEENRDDQRQANM